MQYSTNYVFSKINVSYALALFQLSTVLSVFLGVNIFKEKGLRRKIIASLIMVTGAVIILIT
jgi:drug/metabolite transporter (DMT)-like permease